jgi:hypothetical protein
MERINKLANVLGQHKELQWLMSSIIVSAAGLFGVLTTALIWYL